MRSDRGVDWLNAFSHRTKNLELLIIISAVLSSAFVGIQPYALVSSCIQFADRDICYALVASESVAQYTTVATYFAAAIHLSAILAGCRFQWVRASMSVFWACLWAGTAANVGAMVSLNALSFPMSIAMMIGSLWAAWCQFFFIRVRWDDGSGV